jgi:glutamate-1-semialdehyde aminotransferase
VGLSAIDQKAYDAAACIPGRGLTRSKAPGKMFDVGAGPMFSMRSEGAWLNDINNNRYIDMVLSMGAVTLGHACDGRYSRNVLHSLPDTVEATAAQAVLKHVAPWATHVRFTKTGSEATHAAYRIAKRATGRKHVLMGDWAYHGWHQWCERQEDGKTPEDQFTFFFPHGGDLGETHTGSPEDVAAVFIEPHRWEPVDVEWLRAVRDFCTKHGILLVFDEMIYGGRYALGGATEMFGVVPDLACFGKAFGNGASVAFVVGREAMEQHGQIVSGTYSGDSGGLQSVVSVLDEYVNIGAIGRLWRAGRQLRRGMKEAVEVSRGKIAGISGEPVHQRFDFADKADARRFSALMAGRGVLMHPDIINVSTAHDEQVIEAVVDAMLVSAVKL